MKTLRNISLPSPALALAFLALAISVGGVANAASKAARNSVISATVKNDTLRGKDVKNASLSGTDLLDGSLSGAEIADDSLTGADVDESTLNLAAPPAPAAELPPAGPAGGDLAGAYPNPTIADQAVNAAKVQNGSLGAADLGAGSVDTGELVNSSVNSAKIEADAVGATDVAPGVISGVHVEGESLTGSDIAAGSVAGVDVTNESLTGTDIDDGGVGSADVANESLTSTDINESTLPFGRAGRDSNTNTFDTDGDVATKTIDVPNGGGILFIVGSAQLLDLGNGGIIDCRVELNGTDIPATERQISFGAGWGTTCNVNWAQSVNAGESTVSLEIASLEATEIASDPVLQILFVPFNENGN